MAHSTVMTAPCTATWPDGPHGRRGGLATVMRRFVRQRDNREFDHDLDRLWGHRLGRWSTATAARHCTAAIIIAVVVARERAVYDLYALGHRELADLSLGGNYLVGRFSLFFFFFLMHMKRRDFGSFRRRAGRGNEGNECRGRFRQHAGHSVQLQAGACLLLGRPVLDFCRGGNEFYMYRPVYIMNFF